MASTDRKSNKTKSLDKNGIDRKDKKNEINKKYSSDEQSDFGNKSGFYRLPKNKQNTIMSIIDVLENDN